jgi:hypothetical protein
MAYLDNGTGKRSEVRRDQFKWLGGDLIHGPTGATFASDCRAVAWGDAGRLLSSGEFFDPVDIGFVAGQILLS